MVVRMLGKMTGRAAFGNYSCISINFSCLPAYGVRCTSIISTIITGGGACSLLHDIHALDVGILIPGRGTWYLLSVGQI
jgi:hypothetical protein